MSLQVEIQNYIPYNEQEEKDKIIMLKFLSENDNALTRENEIAHFTASAWVLNKEEDSVLMIYHNIYKSWSWTGGHADGEDGLLQVAIREVQEETGIKEIIPITQNIYSLETITVDGHRKKGKYVSSHLHMNVTYLLKATKEEELIVKPDENSGVKWIKIEEAVAASTEPWMQGIYEKLNLKLEQTI